MVDRRTHIYKHIKEDSDKIIKLKNSLKSIRWQETCHKAVPRRKPLFARPTIWDDVVWEDKEIEKFIRKEKYKNFPKFDCAATYLQKKLFPQLIPAFEKICIVTLLKCAHAFEETRFFDFLDYLAECLYNNNNRYPMRKNNWSSIHMVYKNRKRKFFPYFWFLTPDEAATKIQALVRGFLVRSQMRNLKKIEEELQLEKEMKNKRLSRDSTIKK